MKHLGILLTAGVIVGSLFAIGVMKIVGAAAGSGSSSAIEHAQKSGQYVGSNPPGRIVAPDFQLVSYRGRVVRMSAQRGNVVVLTFLDTDCHDQCPVIASILGRGMPKLAPALRAHAEAIAVSVNPRVDTRKSISMFLAQRHASRALEFLVGSLPKLRSVWSAYHILPAIDTGNNNIHSADVMIFNRRGRWVSSLNEGLDLSASSLAHDIAAAYRDDRS